jgi:hypothetical protein
MAGIGLFAVFYERGFDDPFITYRYAENIAAGRGFVYNEGEQILSTTAPLYAVLLAVARLTGLEVPLASTAIGCMSLAIGGWAFWKLGQLWRSPIAGFVGLMLYPTFPLLVPTLGAETTFYIALILLGLWSYARAQYPAAALLLALAALVRADGVVAAGAAGAHYLLMRRGPIPWAAFGLYAGLLLSWFGFAALYFGAPLPVTLGAKQGQGLMAISQSFFDGLVPQARVFWRNPLYRLHFLLAAIGLIDVMWYRRPWLLLLSWNVLYVIAYSLLGVTSYFWYYGPLQVGFITLVAVGVATIHRWLSGRRWACGLALLLTIAMLVPQIRSLAYINAHPDPRMAVYRAVGEWLHDSARSDATVGTLEVGIIGYYADRRMIDFAGLIQPETAQRFARDTTYEDSAIWATQRFRPNYLVLHAGLFPQLESNPEIQSTCQVVETFVDNAYSHQINIMQCDW